MFDNVLSFSEKKLITLKFNVLSYGQTALVRVTDRFG